MSANGEVHAYILVWDRGFAPNPFHGYCTLGPCVPAVRKAAEVGDWVVGLGAKTAGQGGLLLYAMRVDETMSFTSYFYDSRFQSKKPVYHGTREQWAGDNIYRLDDEEIGGRWSQEHSTHSFPDGTPNWHKANYDLSVDKVLISSLYAYYGAEAIEPHPILLRGQYQGFRGLRTLKPEHRDEVAPYLEELVDPDMRTEEGFATIRPALRGLPSGWSDPRFEPDLRKPFVSDTI